MSDAARERMLAGVPDNTRRAYGRVWAAFTAWCAEHDRTSLLPTAETAAEYVGHLAEQAKAPATIEQALERVGVDQVLELEEHGMQDDLAGLGLHPLAVAGEPRLQVVLLVR